MDIARYIVWLGQRRTIAASIMQTYLSVINKFLKDHARLPMALGPLVTCVRKGLEKIQRDENPAAKCLPLPAPVALSNMEGPEHQPSEPPEPSKPEANIA